MIVVKVGKRRNKKNAGINSLFKIY